MVGAATLAILADRVMCARLPERAIKLAAATVRPSVDKAACGQRL